MKHILHNLTRRWDRWIYRKACASIRRMAQHDPGMTYLMELQVREWNQNHTISPELKRATEHFHASMREHNAEVKRGGEKPELTSDLPPSLQPSCSPSFRNQQPTKI